MPLRGPFRNTAHLGIQVDAFQQFISSYSKIFKPTEHGIRYPEVDDMESFREALNSLETTVDGLSYPDDQKESIRELLRDMKKNSLYRLSALSNALHIIHAAAASRAASQEARRAASLAISQARNLLWAGTYAFIEAALSGLWTYQPEGLVTHISEYRFVVTALHKIPAFESLDLSLNSELSQEAIEIEKKSFPDGPISAIYYAFIHLLRRSFDRAYGSSAVASTKEESNILDRACGIFARFQDDHEARIQQATQILQLENTNWPPGRRIKFLGGQLLQFELEKDQRIGHRRQRNQEKKSWHNFDSTILSLVVVAIVVATVLTTVAGHHQPEPLVEGKQDDMDFFLTIQEMIISLINVAVMIIPTVQKAHMPIQNWGWTWAFWAISVACSIASVVFYTSWVPIVSANLSFAASVAQLLVILQLLADVDNVAREYDFLF